MAINEGKEFVVLQCVAESGRKSQWFSAVLESQSIRTRATRCVSEQLQDICGGTCRWWGISLRMEGAT